jgi:hypothetical protein
MDVEADMKTIVSMLMALIVMSAMPATPLLSAGSDVTGTWTSWKRGDVPVEIKLESSGTSLSGTVRLGTGPAVNIFDGRTEGNSITFKAVVPDGDGEYQMLFRGRHSGRRIDFKCDVDVSVPGEKTEFGQACVSRISVKRAARP